MRDGRLLTLPRPARHHDLIWYAIHVLGYPSPVGGSDDQGFTVKLDGERHSQYCQRKSARKIAEDCNQLIPRAIDNVRLFSEDVWEGRLDREAWLENNTWNLIEDGKIPTKGEAVWYFYEHVGVFDGEYLGPDDSGDHVFGGVHGGGIEATHWMTLTDVKPDLPWACVYENSSIILDEDS